MWYEIRVFGGEDLLGDAAENGGWGLDLRTNLRVEAEQRLGELRKEYEVDDLDWNWG